MKNKYKSSKANILNDPPLHYKLVYYPDTDEVVMKHIYFKEFNWLNIDVGWGTRSTDQDWSIPCEHEIIEQC